MRFRKTRSCLSAYSNDELDARQNEAVREQLAQDELLKRELLIFDQIKAGCRELEDLKLSDDFNARLLNRIAHERFAETRTKAYLPSRIPGLWRRLAVPAMATVAIAFFGLVGYSAWQNLPEQSQATAQAGEQQLGEDDSYLYASSDKNPNLGRQALEGRSLSSLMARVDQADRISNRMTSGAQFVTNSQLASGRIWSGNARRSPIPFSIQYYRVIPILKVKPLAPRTDGEETIY